MKLLMSSLVLFLFSSISFAQQKQLTMEEAILGARTTLAPENLKQLQFIKGSNEYVYLKKEAGTEQWVTGNFSAPAEKPFLSLTQFNAALRTAQLDTVAAFPGMQFQYDSVTAMVKGQKIAYRYRSGQVIVLADKKKLLRENLDESKTGLAAYLDSFNLYVANGSNVKQVTTDGSEKIVYASTVHQSEFGITKGTFWNNQGNALAFYRMDQSKVQPYPLVDWSQRPAQEKSLYYPMAGNESHTVTVGIYYAALQKTTWVNVAGPAEQYLTNICWSPDDAYLYIVVVNRAQDHFWVNQYHAGTGAFVKTLFEEDDPKYAEPLVPMLFVKNKPEQFIWQSRRDGWNHLYLYNADGSLVKQLTKGDWDVVDVKGFDESGSQLFFISTQSSPLSRNLSSVTMKTGVIKAVTSGAFVHNCTISADGNTVIDISSSTDNPRKVQLIDVKSGKSKLLLQATNPTANYATGELSVFPITGKSGDQLYVRMYKPTGFNSAKKYPVIVYWYGGPHAQLILNSWNGGAGDYWFQYMAERGYLVFSIDTRGSSNRGKAFEQAIFRKAGEAQMEDLLTGIDYLKNLSYADTSRMGLFGWSYGGFLTTAFMLRHPGIFKAAVAGGPVMDWSYYEIMYTERYMDKPQENPEGYANSNLISQAGKLKGKLLLIHGLQDNVVLQQHSVLFVKAAVDKGVQVDYMIYPGHEHNVLGKDRVHLYQKVTDYFMLHLP